MIPRFAVVGYGHIGRRHAALIVAQPAARLVALCDPVAPIDPPVTNYTSLNRLLKDGPGFDVACICTPNGLHAEQAVRLLKAGKHVVIEKPLALTTADCDRIQTAAELARRKVFGVMQNRYSPAAAWLKGQLEKQSLGRILQVHVDCFWNRDHRYYSLPDGSPHPWHGHATLDGGVLFTQFAHFIDLLCWAFGTPTVTHSRLHNQHHHEQHDFADTGMVHFELPGGAIGSLNFSTAVFDRNFESTLTVIATQGTVKLGGQYMNDLRYCHAAGMAIPDLPASLPANDYGGYTGSAANHHHVIDNVVDVLNGEAAIATPLAEGREVVGVIEAIYRLNTTVRTAVPDPSVRRRK